MEVTDLERAEREAERLRLAERRQRETRETLAAANLALAQSQELDAILETLLECLGRLVPCDSSMVMLLEGDSTLVAAAQRGHEKWTDPTAARRVTFDTRRNGLLAEILREGKPIVIDDAWADERWEPIPEGRHVRSWLGVPLVIRGKAIGLYSLDKTKPGFFDDEHVSLALTMAPLAASAVEIARLLRDAREAAEFRQQIIASEDQGIIVLDRDHRYRAWNSFMESHTGLPASAVIGRSHREMFPTWAERGIPQMEERALAGETVTTPDIPGTAADGRAVWTSARFSPLRGTDGSITGVLAVVRDITEGKRREALRDEQNRILGRIAASAPLEETLSAVAQLVASSCPGTRCTIVLLDDDGVHMRHGAAPGFPEAFVKAVDGQEIGPGAGSCGAAMFRREAVLVTDILQDPLWADHRHLATLAGVQACWSTPILSDDARVLGAFAAYYAEPRPPDLAERAAIDIAVSVAGIAIQRWRAAETLRRSEARYRTLFESAPDGILVADSEGRYVDVNPSGLAMLGYSRPELIGMSSADILAPREHERVPTALVDITKGVEHRHEWQFRRKDGSEFPADVMATVTADGRILALVRDVSERKRAVEELRESERRFRDMLAHLHLVSLMLDRAARITYCNDYLLQLTGWTAGEVLGRNWFELFIPPGQDAMVDVFSGLLADVPAAWHNENEILTRAGGRRLIRWNHSVLRSATGEVIGTASIGEDITEQKRLEEQLRQSHKMEAVGRLAGGIAHDFNNILGVITGYGEMLRSKTPEGNPDRRRMDEIVRAAERAAGLTRQLLAFSRKQVMEPKVLEPSAVVTEMRRMLEPLIGEHIELVLRAEARGRVKVDPGQLEQVLMNLVVNGRDAMPMGGSLSIETADVHLDEAYIQHRDVAVPAGRYVMIGVTDTGVGMDEDTQARVFEPFFTTKAEGKGTGLGLATVYGIVKQSGGYVWMYSEVGKGTVLRVYLPQVEEDLAQERRRPAAARRLATETVLVVEDEPAARELVAEVLREEGYRVLLASNGLEGVEVARHAEPPLHLLLTDVVLPKLGGRAAAELIRAIHPAVKVLYMSGYTDDEVSRHGVLEPGIILLQKPFTPADLTRRVGEVLDEA